MGIYLLINGMPMILCCISVMWNVCLNGLFKIFFVPLFSWELGKVGFFHNLLMLSPVLLLICWLS